MPLKNIETQEFRKIMQEHIVKTITYLLSVNQEFAIACEIAAVHFDPVLPTDLQDSLNEITLFMIANYSFETATIEEVPTKALFHLRRPNLDV